MEAHERLERIYEDYLVKGAQSSIFIPFVFFI
jgi:hypothetical protein